MPKLTKSLIDNATLKDKPYFIFDTSVTGFCARITKKGKKSYYVQYMKGVQIKRYLIGQHGILTCEQAREKAIIMLGKIKSGDDPQKEKSDKRSELYFQDIAYRFIEEYVDIHLKPTTAYSYSKYLIKYAIPYFKNIKINDIRRPDIAAFHHSLRKKPYSANYTLRILSKLFATAELWGLRDENSNPCRMIKKFGEKKRERYLTKEEALRLGRYIEELKTYPDSNLAATYCIQLLLLTGCRMSEIMTLKWEYYHVDERLIRLPDSKTGAKTVYLSDGAIATLNEIWNHPARPKDNPYVIWGKYEGTHLAYLEYFWRRVRKHLGMNDVRIHDLRHSFASFAVNDGMSLPMIGKLLGHTQTQTTARYAHLSNETMNKAANAVGNIIGDFLKIDTSSLKREESKVKDEIESKPELVIGSNIKKIQFMSPKQVSEYIDVKISLLDYWRWKKKGPAFVKVGNSIRYLKEDIDAFVAVRGRQLIT